MESPLKCITRGCTFQETIIIQKFSLQLICSQFLAAFDEHGRVLIAVTKYDTMYQERKQKRKSEQVIKEVVQRNVQAATGRKISDDAIVLVCGKWALHARLLQWDPDDEHSLQHVIAGLNLADVPRGQTEDQLQNVISMERKSNIHELERGWVTLLPVWLRYAFVVSHPLLDVTSQISNFRCCI